MSPATTTGRRARVMLTADQRQALDAALNNPNITEIAMGGARGTAKTFGACAIVMAWLLQNPCEKAMVLRLTEKAAVENIREPFEAVADLFGVKVRYHVQRGEYYLPNGSEFHIRHMKSAAAYKPQQGQQYGLIWGEEVTQWERTAYMLLGGTRRARRAGVKALRLATGNPGEVGEKWFCERFVDAKTRKPGTLFINSALFESLPTLERNPGYFDEELKYLPEHQQAWWVKGLFGVKVGQYFELPPNLVCEASPPFYAKWYAAADWGYWPDPFAVVWAAKWKEAGRDRMHVGMELGGYRWLPDVQAAKALAAEKKAFDDGYVLGPVRRRFADAQAFRRQEHESQEMGRTIAGMWRKHGFYTQKPSTMARIAGWQVIKTLMDVRFGSRPGQGILTIDPRCVSLLEEFEFAVQGEAGSQWANDIDPKCGDHWLRALAWICVSTFGTEYKPKPKDPWEMARERAAYESNYPK